MKIVYEITIKPKDYAKFLEEQQCYELDNTPIKKEHRYSAMSETVDGMNINELLTSKYTTLEIKKFFEKI